MSLRVSRFSAVVLLVGALLFATGPGALADPDAVGGTASGRRAALAAVAQGATTGVTTAAVTPVDSSAASAETLARAAVEQGVAGASFVHVPPTSGTHAVTSTFGNYTPAGQAALLTTGDAALADDPNDYQSSGRDAKGGVDRGARTYDVTVLKIDFSVPSGVNCLQMSFRFFTEEYPEFSDATYDDAFIAELDSLGWDTTGTTITAPNNFAVGGAGTIVSSRNADELGMTREHATGTTYDAATPTTTARVSVTPGNHTLYLSIFDQYDAVYDSAVLVDRITASQRPTCPRGFEEPHTPTIFVPGILGTKMYEGSVEQWPRWFRLAVDVGDSHLNGIKLKADGITNEVGGAHHGDVLLKIPVYDIYGEMLQKLISRGFVYDSNGSPARGETLFLHPTDWRRSASWNASKLLEHVEQVRAATGVDKVNIIAHSQGGLAVRQMLSLAGSISRVNRVVTLGTPYLGTPQALTLLRYQTPCMFWGVDGFCALNRSKLSEIATNFPGFLELLPSPALWAASGSLVKTEYLDGTIKTYTYDEFLAQKMGDFNVPLIQQAADWHRGHDDWSPADPNVGLLRIIGRNYYTIRGITEQEYVQCVPRAGCFRRWRNVLDKPGSGASGNGDSMVLTSSADPSTHGGKGRTEYVDASHDFLDSNDGAIDLALEIFKGVGPLAAAEADAAASIATANTSITVSSDPGGLTGVEVTVDGPATGLFTDRDGWRTGIVDASTGESTVAIPGSSFFPSTEQSLTFLTGTHSDGRWTATADGEIRLILRTYADDVIESTVAYPAAAVDEGAILTLDALTAPLQGSAPVLRIDDDADGTADRMITPLAPVTIDDTDPPVSTVTATPYTAGDGSTRYRVTVTATDPSGAGVDRIEWLHTSDGTYRFNPYTTTLDLPATGTLYVRATDRAGNVERNLPTVTLDQ